MFTPSFDVHPRSYDPRRIAPMLTHTVYDYTSCRLFPLLFLSKRWWILNETHSQSMKTLLLCLSYTFVISSLGVVVYRLLRKPLLRTRASHTEMMGGLGEDRCGRQRCVGGCHHDAGSCLPRHQPLHRNHNIHRCVYYFRSRGTSCRERRCEGRVGKEGCGR
jgi:hypothetical protein